MEEGKRRRRNHIKDEIVFSNYPKIHSSFWNHIILLFYIYLALSLTNLIYFPSSTNFCFQSKYYLYSFWGGCFFRLPRLLSILFLHLQEKLAIKAIHRPGFKDQNVIWSKWRHTSGTCENLK